MYSKLSEEQNLKKIAEYLYIFLITPDQVEKSVVLMQLNSSDNCLSSNNFEILNDFEPELQLINTKPLIKNK